MTAPDLYIRNARCVTGTDVFHGGVLVRGGVIEQLVDGDVPTPAREVIDAGRQLLLPGLVDPHVHFSEPGRSHWEGFATGTRAAAAGGVTTVLDMPLNASPPTTDTLSFDRKLAAARATAVVDFGLWGGLVDDNLADLAGLQERGVVGYKAFLCESATDFKRVDDHLLREGLRRAAELGLPVGVHAENEWVTRYLSQQLRAAGRVDRAAWGEARPPEAELEAIHRAIFWAQVTGGRLHLAHVSQAAGIDAVLRGKAQGVAVSAETCPHYLFFDEGDLVRVGPVAKCAPPLRPRAMVEALWDRLLDGNVDIIASDHSPCLLEEKLAGHDDIWQAWGGISGLQSGLAVMLTEGVAKRGLGLPHLVRMMSANPARVFGLYPRKGSLAPGSDADLVLVDDSAQHVLQADDLLYKNRHSAYVGHTFSARVSRTLVRGRTVFRDGVSCGSVGFGELVQPRTTIISPISTASSTIFP